MERNRLGPLAPRCSSGTILARDSRGQHKSWVPAVEVVGSRYTSSTLEHRKSQKIVRSSHARHVCADLNLLEFQLRGHMNHSQASSLHINLLNLLPRRTPCLPLAFIT